MFLVSLYPIKKPMNQLRIGHRVTTYYPKAFLIRNGLSLQKRIYSLIGDTVDYTVVSCGKKAVQVQGLLKNTFEIRPSKG